MARRASPLGRGGHQRDAKRVNLAPAPLHLARKQHRPALFRQTIAGAVIRCGRAHSANVDTAAALSPLDLEGMFVYVNCMLMTGTTLTGSSGGRWSGRAAGGGRRTPTALCFKVTSTAD
ncbi:hypothetical protein EVAR_45587_1 [Eumeta japonica]|uniref:Uncharacterized protein n=1 Tax=Eumeta variegata TaxID=151549 RepID=A0A4C1YT23_EUMVA|nr:hypothetical protein EVAR_45587_1 [Eumeta japonica]